MADAYAQLRSALGADRVRDAVAADTVSGVTPRWVATVDGTEQTAAALRAASRHGLRVVPRGAGSKIDWGGRPEAVDLVLDLSAAAEVIEHAAGDLVVRAKAGTPLAEVQRVVGQAGQQLAIDHPVPGATVGGVIGTALSGPCRHFFGGVRDLLIGITVVLADGTVTASGGKVVKNVAGYDLGKLYTGSHGTLGVITEAVFRLHPRAAEHRWLAVSAGSLTELLATLRRSQAMPTAIEVDASESGTTLCVQVEGRPEVTQTRASVLADTLAELGAVDVLDQPPEWWGQLPFTADGTGLRLGVRPAETPRLLEKLRELGVTARGAAGLGVVHVGLPGDTEPHVVAELVTELRQEAEYVVIERAPQAVHTAVDPWGEQEPGVLSLMRRVKKQFDPEHRLAPGRFVGGI